MELPYKILHRPGVGFSLEADDGRVFGPYDVNEKGGTDQFRKCAEDLLREALNSSALTPTDSLVPSLVDRIKDQRKLAEHARQRSEKTKHTKHSHGAFVLEEFYEELTGRNPEHIGGE